MWILRLIKNSIKYNVAKIWREKLVEDMDKLRLENKLDEKWNQKWIHIQGQVLTKGKMKWNWKKVL